MKGESESRSAPLADNSVLRRVLSSIFGSGAMSVLGMGVSFLVGVQLARYMAPDSFGIYSGVIAIFFIAVIPPQLGLPTMFVRKMANRLGDGSADNELSGMIRYAMIAVPLAGLICALISAGVLALYGWQVYALYGFGIVCLYPLIAVSRGVLIGLGLVTLSQGLEHLARPSLFALLLFLTVPSSGGMSVHGAMLAHLASLLLATCLIGGIALREIAKHRVWRAPTYAPRNWLRSGAPIVGWEIFRSYNAQMAILVSGLFVLASELGDLRIALTIATLFGFPQSVVNLALAPVVARYHEAGDSEKLQNVTALTTCLAVAAQLAAFVILALFGEVLISALFGAAYAGAAPLMMCLITGHLLLGCLGPSAIILLMANKESYVFKISMVIGVLQTIIALALLPIFGVFGAAFAASFGVAIQGVIFTFEAYRKFGYRLNVFSSAARLMRQHFGQKSVR